MKEYIKPIIEIEKFDVEDSVLTSGLPIGTIGEIGAISGGTTEYNPDW